MAQVDWADILHCTVGVFGRLKGARRREAIFITVVRKCGLRIYEFNYFWHRLALALANFSSLFCTTSRASACVYRTKKTLNAKTFPLPARRQQSIFRAARL